MVAANGTSPPWLSAVQSPHSTPVPQPNSRSHLPGLQPAEPYRQSDGQLSHRYEVTAGRSYGGHSKSQLVYLRSHSCHSAGHCGLLSALFVSGPRLTGSSSVRTRSALALPYPYSLRSHLYARTSTLSSLAHSRAPSFTLLYVHTAVHFLLLRTARSLVYTVFCSPALFLISSWWTRPSLA